MMAVTRIRRLEPSQGCGGDPLSQMGPIGRAVIRLVRCSIWNTWMVANCFTPSIDTSELVS